MYTDIFYDLKMPFSEGWLQGKSNCPWLRSLRDVEANEGRK